ncbi:MAG: thioredoxin family protein [Candidatus Hydrothermarchaeota archaeon]|nr:thioredoxin family protein [Candidatus Hydrothermarchaeota archaeon]
MGLRPYLGLDNLMEAVKDYVVRTMEGLSKLRILNWLGKLKGNSPGVDEISTVLLPVAVLMLLSGCLGSQVQETVKETGIETKNPGIEALAGIDWAMSYDEGLRIAERENKPVLVYFWAVWCGFCKKMDEEVLPASEVSRAIEEKFVPVNLDVDLKDNSKLIAKYRVVGTPTFVIATGQEEILDWVVGYRDKKEFIDFLAGSRASMGESGTGMGRFF